ncbi:protein CREG1-like isoform X1 [Petromyzon marinus]|uniref:protein CREG1-like isoform X1 n=1 Tax=Petromyzon marinus TaxID=7757 RepID=UPI003F72290F
MRALPLLCFAAAIAAAAAASSSSRPPPPLHLQATDQSERRVHRLNNAAAPPLDVLAGSDQPPQPLHLQSTDQSERRVHRLNNAAAAPPLDVLAGSDQPPPQPQQPLHLHLRATDQSERRVHRLTSASSKIPPHEQVARVARFVAHAVDWAALATLSGRAPPGRGLPFASVFSVSDGPAGDASGVPYMYLSSLDVSVKDIAADPRVSMTMTLASTDYCSRGVYDPQSPLCARVTLIGNVSRVVDEAEAAFARVALFSRHPEMRQWPPSHGWFLARLDIASVWVVDYFGGPVVVSPKDYYNARP